jgi:lipopolysaccharide export system permease protein
MRILDLYIGRAVLQNTLVVFAVLLGLFTFVTFVDELGDMGTGNYGALQVMQFVVLSIPMIVYSIFPMAALLGCIIGLSAMAKDSELVVIRAAGVSVARLVGSVMKVGALLAIAAILIGEFVTPYTESRAQQVRVESMQGNVRQQFDFGLWMRDENSYVSIGEILPDLSLLDVKIFEFDAERRLRSLSFAKVGRFENERWLLRDLQRTRLYESKSESEVITAAYWTTVVSPDILQVFLIQPEQLSALQLVRYIAHLRNNVQETENYELAFWRKIMVPFTTAVMLILAIPFVFRQARSGALGRGLFVGIMLGLGFFVVNEAFSYFVLLYDIPPAVGASVPTIGVFILGMVMLRRVQ